ncbi:hypothetical protein PSM7751_01661 [Pseudooceanicola marinus]|uniref:DUF2177 domain-containing protein n=1 Tax=Pseudooceanicola marinus TaxID=396013 RepID=A0A1X6Z1V5_9RHOB|nr:DUF2177 family protein [Pseudooceanicola marinus]MBY5972774.1 DUF2177 family protein [Ferrimonas balearica]MCA1336630.1 DUF2177 family protein [Pseudooceanicola marinus]PJE32442.1 DUF2177 domain-containing protein [Pseudooceanicola marinus]SLN37539.1 hypothetical protein PSM7751_01661 [Pseudooceanicola marinus]
MQLVTLYLITALVFLGLDALMLKNVMRPLFESRLGDQILEDPRMVAAGLFYLAYVGGLLYFVSVPALEAGKPSQALLNGALIGAMAYGTYEVTNYAVLRAWSPVMVAVDLSWGTVLTGVSAALGVWATRAIFPAA